MRDELDARDKQLSDTVAEIEKLREDQHSLKGEVKDRGSAIATLQTELEKVRGEVLERDVAIANLKSELDAREDKQLNLFPGQDTTPIPTPEPESITAVPVFETEPENTESPAVNPEPLTVTPTEVVQTEIPLLDSIEGTVSVGGLMEHIREVKQKNPAFPDPPEKTQTFTDAVTGKTNRLGELERLYGFKLAGYVMKGKKREYRYTIN